MNISAETDLTAGKSWANPTEYPSPFTGGIFVNDYVDPFVIQLVNSDRSSRLSKN